MADNGEKEKLEEVAQFDEFGYTKVEKVLKSWNICASCKSWKFEKLKELEKNKSFRSWKSSSSCKSRKLEVEKAVSWMFCVK